MRPPTNPEIDAARDEMCVSWQDVCATRMNLEQAAVFRRFMLASRALLEAQTDLIQRQDAHIRYQDAWLDKRAHGLLFVLGAVLGWCLRALFIG